MDKMNQTHKINIFDEPGSQSLTSSLAEGTAQADVLIGSDNVI